MTKIERTFDVPARPENVFAEVSDPARWPRWCDFVKSASPSGSRAHWVYNLGGMKFEADPDMTEPRHPFGPFVSDDPDGSSHTASARNGRGEASSGTRH